MYPFCNVYFIFTPLADLIHLLTVDPTLALDRHTVANIDMTRNNGT